MLGWGSDASVSACVGGIRGEEREGSACTVCDTNDKLC
jgi:hypothetical protein